MKRFSIFRKGRHTAMSGHTLDFSEDQLREAVAAYDPALHEAPIVVGHPKDNAPAYGWVGALHYNEATGEVEVDPAQVDEAFAEMVAAGRFKKRSASWYLPDAPNNPKPGTLYLRHVGFLGAMPPAVKGLKDVAFSEEEGAVTVEYADRYTWGTLASLFRGIREWFISEKDIETADRIVPAYAISELESASRTTDSPDIPAAAPAFSEEEDTMKIEELQAQLAAVTAERDQLKAQAAKYADFSERESALAAREQALAERESAIARAGVEARIDAAIKAGKALPAQRVALVNFALSLADGEAVIEFGEGDKVEKITQREAYLRQIEAAPKVVDYSEVSAPDGSTPSEKAADPNVIAKRAREIQADAQSKGLAVSFTEAVAQATAEFTAE